MKKVILLAIVVSCVTVTVLMAQTQSKGLLGNIGIGANAGLQKIYADGLPNGKNATSFAPAAEGYLRFMLSKRFNLAMGIGYGELSDGHPFETKHYVTNMLVGDIRGNFNIISTGKFRPFISFGLGIHNWQYKSETPHPFYPQGATDRFTDAHVFPGGGFEFFVSPKLAFNALADYRFVVTGPADYLDGRAIKGSSKDGYLNMRAGVTFYFEDQLNAQMESEEGLIANLDQAGAEASVDSPFSESDSDLAEKDRFAVFESKIDRLDQNEAEFTMEQYVRLKSRVDELRTLIEERAAEVDELKTTIDFKDNRLSDLEQEFQRLVSGSTSGRLQRPDASGAASGLSFTTNYEAALREYYANNYSQAIQQFSDLINTVPNHKLASNCEYWIGESYYGMGSYSEATAAFKRVLDYPKSFKKDDAALMLGKCYMSLGDYDSAKEYLEILMRDFPDSEYTGRAENLLAQLN